MATGEGLIKAVALYDPFLPQEPPQHKHIVGAIPAVHYRCCWLANEGSVTLRERLARPARQITTLPSVLCVLFNWPPRHVFHTFVANSTFASCLDASDRPIRAQWVWPERVMEGAGQLWLKIGLQ